MTCLANESGVAYRRRILLHLKEKNASDADRSHGPTSRTPCVAHTPASLAAFFVVHRSPYSTLVIDVCYFLE